MPSSGEAWLIDGTARVPAAVIAAAATLLVRSRVLRAFMMVSFESRWRRVGLLCDLQALTCSAHPPSRQLRIWTQTSNLFFDRAFVEAVALSGLSADATSRHAALSQRPTGRG